MARFKGRNWNVGGDEGDGSIVKEWPAHEGRKLAILMDIRDELQRLNNVFQCSNFTTLPKVIKQIRANTGRLPARKGRTK